MLGKMYYTTYSKGFIRLFCILYVSLAIGLLQGNFWKIVFQVGMQTSLYLPVLCKQAGDYKLISCGAVWLFVHIDAKRFKYITIGLLMIMIAGSLLIQWFGSEYS